MLALLLTAWSVGIMAVTLLGSLLPGIGLAAIGAAAAAIVSRRHALLAGLALAAFILGAGRATLVTEVALPSSLIGQKVVVSGSVDDDPVDRKGTRRLTVRLDHALDVAGELPGDLRVQATIYGTIPVNYGDLVLLTGELMEPPRFDQFDYRAYLAEQGIAGVMPSARLVRVTSRPGEPVHALLFAVRRAVIAGVGRALPEPQAALLLGVVFGYRAALPPALEKQMISSGLIHIVVISGLKVSLLARIIHQSLGRWLPRGTPYLAVTAMASYALFAGASAAALRAAAMGMLTVIAGQLRRDSHVAVSLALTGALMLGLKPALAHDVSFQLSFAGTIGIAAMTDGIAGRLGLVPAILRDPFAATVAAEAATWPLMLADFHQISLIAPLANALVLPLLPALMVIGGAGALIGLAAPLLSWPLLQAGGAIVGWFRVVIEGLGSTPMSAIAMPYFPPRWLAAATILNGGALAGIKLRQFFWQRRAWFGLVAAALIMVALFLIRPDGRVHVYALDVGSGSAVVVRTANGHQILVDAGPDADRFAQSIGRALPPTARSIDLWLITGGRRVNIGAAAAVLSRFRIERIVIADPDPWSATLRALVQQAQASAIPVVAGAGTFEVDGVNLRLADDERSWLIQDGRAVMAIVPPETSWSSLPASVDGAVFTNGGPRQWQGPGHGFSVVQVAAQSRDGLPVRAVLTALASAPLSRTDRQGIIELVTSDGRFRRANP